MSPQDAAVRAFYDDRWNEFRYANRLKCIRAATIVDFLARTRTEEPKILDVGCGAGWMTNILSMFGPATGIELSPLAVEQASARYSQVKFFAADVRTFESADKFDVVVAQEVLEHFERHEEFVESVSRLIRPGGWLILTTPNAATLAAMNDQQRQTFQNQPVENPLTMTQLKRLLGTRFRVDCASTVVAGFGEALFSYRLVHSRKVWKLWNGIFGPEAAENLSCRLGFGLHLAVLAQKIR
jgi:trans-aconitate methyltransferase